MPDDSFKEFVPGPLSALPELRAGISGVVFGLWPNLSSYKLEATRI